MVQILAGSAWTIYGRLKYPLGEMLASRSSPIFHAITQLLGTIMASYTEWERRFLEIEELLKVCFRQILSNGENPLPSTEKIQPSYFFFFSALVNWLLRLFQLCCTLQVLLNISGTCRLLCLLWNCMFKSCERPWTSFILKWTCEERRYRQDTVPIPPTPTQRFLLWFSGSPVVMRTLHPSHDLQFQALPPPRPPSSLDPASVHRGAFTLVWQEVLILGMRLP